VTAVARKPSGKRERLQDLAARIAVNRRFARELRRRYPDGGPGVEAALAALGARRDFLREHFRITRAPRTQGSAAWARSCGAERGAA
jgi:hypothetical protein